MKTEFSRDPSITVDQISHASWFEHLHGHGARGMYVYVYTCREFPRLTCEVRCERRRAPETKTFIVDGKEYPDLPTAADALNEPHDTENIAERLGNRLFRKSGVEFIEGRLVVYGETASRAEKRRKSFPLFEGVPVEWVIED